ncbi:MAG: GYD domain-containing protein, partial [Pseudomonadota bacterium]|nr:GYD domain-containing protein [Pseudomonadota bacterium]
GHHSDLLHNSRHFHGGVAILVLTMPIVDPLIKDLGGEIKEVYFTPGENDMLLIVEAPDGEVMMKFKQAVATQGNVRTNTTRGFTEAEFQRIVADLP